MKATSQNLFRQLVVPAFASKYNGMNLQNGAQNISRITKDDESVLSWCVMRASAIQLFQKTLSKPISQARKVVWVVSNRSSLLQLKGSLKARLHRRFLSQQLDAIFVVFKVATSKLHV